MRLDFAGAVREAFPDFFALKVADEKRQAAERAQQELIQSAEETLAEFQSRARDVKVSLGIPEGDEEPTESD